MIIFSVSSRVREGQGTNTVNEAWPPADAPRVPRRVPSADPASRTRSQDGGAQGKEGRRRQRELVGRAAPDCRSVEACGGGVRAHDGGI